ncbi:hypothetical protein DCAR_0205658 [Daucus carota subsp. sativus]|uniref:Uncharacterized protein n=1 Tax=Daucus carota subsp. sativus TaxID=79200 RepID=A0A166CRM1_DAUCS|nr:hypothetical protein DCAR_0205658 [Daucus carota subsp. sativus]
MESFKAAKVFTIFVMVLVAFLNLGATAALEGVSAPAPSPTPESAGTMLGVPAALAAIISLVAYFV